MGLFSVKEYVCDKCGETFQKRINRNGNVCDRCLKQQDVERKSSYGSYKEIFFLCMRVVE